MSLIALGTVPAGEAPASPSESDYAGRAFWQCRRFIALLRHAIGPEPAGARLRVRRSEQDLDPYLEVVIEYDNESTPAHAYAIRCDHDAPRQWDERPATVARGTSREI